MNGVFNRRNRNLFLILYILIILLFTFACRERVDDMRISLEPFRALRHTVVFRDGFFNSFVIASEHGWQAVNFRFLPRNFRDAFLNILLFVPFGMLCRKTYLRKVVLYAFLLSLAIETIQLITHYGCFELDDLMHNTMGACIGYLINYAVPRIILKAEKTGHESKSE